MIDRMSLLKNNEFRPMLAHKVGNKIDFSQPVFVQAKLDGIRCYITKDGAFTRNGKEIKNVEHVKAKLVEFFTWHPDFILDGELYNHKLKDNFNKIVSLVKKQKPTEADRKESESLIQFHWYDVVTDEKQQERARRIKEMYNFFFGRRLLENTIGMVRTFEVQDQKQIDAMHKQYLLEGYEGTIVRLNGQYKVSGRSKDLLKVKDFEDTEATIIDAVEGKGRLAGRLGKFVMRDAQGVVFGCPAGKFTHAQRKEMWENRKDFIGKEATFEFFQRTPDNSYRHPLFKAIRDYD